MMKNKKLIRLLCALLSVLMMVGMIPALTLAAAAADDSEAVVLPNDDYINGLYETAEEYIEDGMTKYYSNGEYSLYCDAAMGIVAYKNEKTGEVLFTNPWSMKNETNKSADVRAELMSQIVFTYSYNDVDVDLNSYTHAALKDQITVKHIKNGLRVEYAIGEPSARMLVPQMIERSAFETKILKFVEEAYNNKAIAKRDFDKFKGFFNEFFYTDEKLGETMRESIAKKYPVTKEKNLDIYVLDVNATEKDKIWLEDIIRTYCAEYSFEEMDNDYDLVNFEEIATSPAVFKMALEYKIDDLGVSVTLAGNGLRYDETVYRVKNFKILPYMGASYKKNDGYSFIPDGSGVLYELDSTTTTFSNVYGDDYALQDKLSGYHNEVMRMPVFGQVETSYADKEGNWISKNDYNALADKTGYTSESRGFLAIIEEGDSLAIIRNNHRSNLQYASVIPEFTTRQSDESSGGWNVYAGRRYTDDYSIRYIMLSDDASSDYKCSWLGMACAYRQYLESQNNGFDRLTAEDVSTSIPLYIETFGCMDTIQKVLSMPVTVSVSLTSFEDIATMYDYLAANGVTNVNFKMKGYANGGLYADVPYDLDWESAVGGDSGFEDLLEKAAATKGALSLYPDFDFVYTSQADVGGSLSMKKHAARTIDNRYTAKRVYSATYQSFVSYFQMVLSPATYSYFYEALEEEYAEYGATGISLGTLGNSLNSDFDEDKTTLREEAKQYVVEGLAYFKGKNYDIMLDGGNAYTWGYANHILNVAIDSSRYIAELSAVPFAGVVLHGYKEFAGTPMNMEGNLSYAMLKAMECGASAYFVLCYAKEASSYLKSDEALSQNYSVRYDIWQKRLVEIYAELNSVLADVQTKLLVDWERLDASRVPDEDELLKDIMDAAEEAKKAIAEQIEADRVAKLQLLSDARVTISGAAQLISNIHNGTMIAGMKMMLEQLAWNEDNSLMKTWRPEGTPVLTEQQAQALSDLLNAYVITPYANMCNAMQEAKDTLLKAKIGYDLLRENNVNSEILKDAKDSLEAAIAEYVALLNGVETKSYVLTDLNRDTYVNGTDSSLEALEALMTITGSDVEMSDVQVLEFLFGTDERDVDTLVESIGWEQIYEVIIRGLEIDGYYNSNDLANSLIKVDDLLHYALTGTTPEPPASDEGGEEEEGPAQDGDEETGDEEEEPEAEVVMPDPPKSKYAVDNNVVAVSYGESKNDVYKTLLLNFNDYTIQTTYNGVTYTIEAYGYVVIMR
ncbi:MAG: hypothetical protein J6U87_06015 [Clostridia bacterium]|nr:hypothetical protein [Clostridia bacterium]